MPIDHENLRLDHTHCRAICDEIGERLRETMGQEFDKHDALPTASHRSAG